MFHVTQLSGSKYTPPVITAPLLLYSEWFEPALSHCGDNVLGIKL
jgi:hypothetical protein